MISLFLARYNEYFMFKDSNVFEFTNFPFKTKYNNTVVYSVISNYLFSRRKQKTVTSELALGDGVKNKFKYLYIWSWRGL